MWIYVLMIIVVVIIIYVFILHNSFVKLNNKVQEAFAMMDVYLKKRWDLIPSIVQTVKGYAQHEKNTLKEVVALRNNVYDSMSNEEKIKTNEKLSAEINKLMILVDTYPDLKANENFNDLTNQKKEDLSIYKDEFKKAFDEQKKFNRWK